MKPRCHLYYLPEFQFYMLFQVNNLKIGQFVSGALFEKHSNVEGQILTTRF